MLQYYMQLLYQRTLIMAFSIRNFGYFRNGIQNYARPFEDILHSYDATSTNNDSLCLGSTPTKDTLT
jgi:hypothetical protein